MDDNGSEIIIKRIKKIKKSNHHGGSWKIAYADFVTAMMAFFLIMWLLALLNKSQLQSISEYFKNPQKTGLVDQGSRVNKDKKEDFYLEKGKQKEKWKDMQKETKKEDAKLQVQATVKVNTKIIPATNDPAQKLKELKKSLEAQLENNPQMQQYKNNLNFVLTANGLKIILKDLENKPMFSKGKTDFEKYASDILSWLSKQLNSYPNQIVIVGHTDTIQFTNDKYTNWELSADRANATRRVLIKNGMDADKIVRVIGEADKQLLDAKNGANPSNRRIDIIVLTDEAAKKMQQSK